MLAEGEGREVAMCGGGGKHSGSTGVGAGSVLNRKNSVLEGF
jgi:hypothetical protein